MRFHLRLARALALALTLAATAGADPIRPTPYELSTGSNLAWGCMGPCACPVIFTGSLKGGFTLLLTGVSQIYAHYDVRDIEWSYVVPGTDRVVHVTGQGSYDHGGEFALTQRMQLDLVTDGAQQQHFDSGFVPGGATFPAIDIEVHVDPSSCLDSALHVVAAPAPASVEPQPPGLRLAAAPNPTHAAVEIVVTLPRAGRARVEVLDVHGRALATLADGTLAEGETRLAWDGRTRTGSDAGVGVFWVRARMGSRTVAHRVVRFR